MTGMQAMALAIILLGAFGLMGFLAWLAPRRASYREDDNPMWAYEEQTSREPPETVRRKRGTQDHV